MNTQVLGYDSYQAAERMAAYREKREALEQRIEDTIEQALQELLATTNRWEQRPTVAQVEWAANLVATIIRNRMLREPASTLDHTAVALDTVLPMLAGKVRPKRAA